MELSNSKNIEGVFTTTITVEEIDSYNEKYTVNIRELGMDEVDSINMLDADDDTIILH